MKLISFSLSQNLNVSVTFKLEIAQSYLCFLNTRTDKYWFMEFGYNKGPVKLIKWVKIPLSFLQSVSNQFHVIILSLPM